jgi:enoyl-CoA hydratase/carnithine racemase
MNLLESERHGAVLRLVLSDAATRNSLSEQMIDELSRAIYESGDARVIVLAATGPAFSSGHNLKELTAHRNDADKGEAYFSKIFGKCAALMIAITQTPCPVIAEVDGLASAAGCQLVATCDLAYASEKASFCTPGVNIGLFCSTPMVALSRSVAQKHAMEMLLTGEVYDAAHAYRIGLVNGVVERQNLTNTVMNLAQQIASKSSVAIGFGKPAFHEQSNLDLKASYAKCSAVMVQNMLEGEAVEGVTAFIEKRKPVWE